MNYLQQRKMQPGDQDQRYRLSVILVADKRPSYWEFHCPKCTQKLCELSGTLLSITDAADTAGNPDYQPAPMAIECKGKYCRIWFEFLTLSGRD